MKSNDILVSDLELAEFCGEATEDTSAADATLSALRRIPANDLTPTVARVIIACIASRIAASNFAHCQTNSIDAIAAVEYLDDAQTSLGD